ncbi:major facilitator superfamily MFS_1 [Fibrisoma limi BUZ 3]|uniref:Major facilitator superfamily MFS_1 n=1 Tax=Fibrisoma limi BUZ 3 TaxID=1185876 RepID=I2GMM7_9BACT|nr:MFS transporter [Fibrisoma limi]CCH55155.1 major facilitator superfamily MFS_1 [Fibrisoma limi BUZ 3]
MFNDRRLLLIYTIVLIDVIVGSAIGPIMPEFVKGLPNPQLWLSAGTALFLGMQLFSAPLLGKLADGYGRRPIVIISAIGTFAADCLLLPVRVGFYFANRLSDGTTNGMYAAVRSAITDISPKDQLFKNLGIEGAIISLGFVVGPMASGLLLTTFDVVPKDQAAYVTIMAVTLSGINMLLSWGFRETHANPPGISRQALKGELINALNVQRLWARLSEKSRRYHGLKQLVLMQLALTFSTGYYNYFVAYLSVGQLHMDAKSISYTFIYFGLLSIVINYIFYTYIADRINQRRAIFWFAVLGTPTLAAYGLVGTSEVMFYVVLTIDCLTLSLIQGLIEGLMAQLTTDEDRGEIFGINQAMQGLGSFATTLIFGAISLIDLRLPFAWFAGCLMLLTWLAARQLRRPVALPIT